MNIQQAMDLALQRHKAGRLAEAEAIYRQILAQQPNHADAWHYLGVIAHQAGRHDVAVDLISRATRLRPDSAEAFNNLGVSLKDNGRVDDAIVAYRQAIALMPKNADAYNNLGVALAETDHRGDAIAAFHQAIAFNPDDAGTFRNLSKALHDQGQFEQAIAACRRAIVINPGFADAHYILAMMLLLQGDFVQGWAEHEWRWRSRDFRSTRWSYSQPQWNGSDLSGRTLLLHTEQGFGDAVQFIRYVPMAAARCGRVIVTCQPELRRLFESVRGIAQLLTTGDPLPPFDSHCPLLSLPLVFGTTLQAIPDDVPYVRCLGEYADMIVQKSVHVSECGSIGVGAPVGTHTDTPTLPHPDTRRSTASTAGAQHTFNVGLVWAGRPTNRNDRNRSIPLSLLAPLAGVSGVRLFSLQTGPSAEQAKHPTGGMKLIDWTQGLHDFADTAALIANLDLVISVDTAVAHLAGAMGKPVWTLLPFAPDWRWLLDRNDSPWYPTMRLFRQPNVGDWDSVIRKVSDALRGFVQGESV